MQFEKIFIGLVVAFVVMKGIELYFLTNSHFLNSIAIHLSSIRTEMHRYNNNIANVAHGRPVA